MSRQKTRKFQENLERNNIIQSGKPFYENSRGRWNEDYFKNNFPITVELGCGRGEYTVGLAKLFANQNFIGIDLKGDRLWKGSGIAIDENLNNIAFLRSDLKDIENHFLENELSEIWITFPDPRPKKRDAKRRLTNPKFMANYRQLLNNNGWVKFKTDNTDLFDYTLDCIDAKEIPVKNLNYTHDLYNSPLMEDHFGVVTKYEKLFSDAGENIKYMKFQFD